MKFFDKLNGWWIVGAYFFWLFAMGGVYYGLTPSENGLYFGGKPVHDLTCLQAFYFSAVTITSLGYGDYQPMGWSRIIASAEVIIGLALMGMLIYKLTSLRTSHHLTRLYNSDITGKLHQYAKDFATVAENMENSLSALVRHAQPTPGGTNAPSAEQMEAAQEEAYRNLSELHKQIVSFKSFMRDEDDLKDFFNMAPPQPMGDAVDKLTDCIKFLGQLLTDALLSNTTAAIVGSTKSRRIRAILETTAEILSYVESRPMKQDTRDKFNSLESAYRDLSEVFKEDPPDTANIQPVQDQDQELLELEQFDNPA